MFNNDRATLTARTLSPWVYIKAPWSFVIPSPHSHMDTPPPRYLPLPGPSEVLPQPTQAPPQYREVQTPQAVVRWLTRPVTSEGLPYPKRLGDFSVDLMAGSTDVPIELRGCSVCILFRPRTRRNEDRCTCVRSNVSCFLPSLTLASTSCLIRVVNAGPPIHTSWIVGPLEIRRSNVTGWISKTTGKK